MLVVVAVIRRPAARGQIKQPHGEVGSTVRGGEKDAGADADCAGRFNWDRLGLSELDEFH
jgi:hypothetical protein